MPSPRHPFENVTVPEGAVGIQWFGQSSFALKDATGAIIQVDPYFPRDRPADRYIHAEPPLDEATLRTDYVLLTHDHSDHTCVESLQRIYSAFPQAQFVGPPESIRRLAAQGIPTTRLTTITAGEIVQLGSLRAHAVWAKPPEGVPEEGIKPPDVQHLGYVVDVGDIRVYISGDPINSFAEHDPLIAPIRVLHPHIGLLTTHPTEGEFPYLAGSAKMAARLGLKAAVPAHYHCFVKRTYDPHVWAAHFPADGPRPLIMPYGGHIIYPVTLLQEKV